MPKIILCARCNTLIEIKEDHNPSPEILYSYCEDCAYEVLREKGILK